MRSGNALGVAAAFALSLATAGRPARAQSTVTSDGVVDDATGYVVVFSAAATVVELFSAGMLGLGVANLVDAYDRRPLADVAATVDAARSIHDGADDLELIGWIGLSVGTVFGGLAAATDIVIGEDSNDDDWWIRPCVTTPIAALGTALLTSGILQLYRADEYRGFALDLSTTADRRGTLAKADTLELTGWTLIGFGAAAIVGAGTAWLFGVLDLGAEGDVRPDDDGETEEGAAESTAEDVPASPAVSFAPLAGPQAFGLQLSLVF